jgi:hypothetical protein
VPLLIISANALIDKAFPPVSAKVPLLTVSEYPLLKTTLIKAVALASVS